MVIPSRRKGCFLSSPSRIRPSNEILTSHTSRPSSSLSARPPFYTCPLIVQLLLSLVRSPTYSFIRNIRWEIKKGGNTGLIVQTRHDPPRYALFSSSRVRILRSYRDSLVASPTPGDYSRVDINFSVEKNGITRTREMDPMFTEKRGKTLLLEIFGFINVRKRKKKRIVLYD